MDKFTFSAKVLIVQVVNVLAVLAIIVGCMWLLIVLRKHRKQQSKRKQKEVKETLGENIRKNRKRMKMTQELVAEYVGVSRQAVAKWEGGISDPSTSNLIALAMLFDMDVNRLISGCNERKKE